MKRPDRLERVILSGHAELGVSSIPSSSDDLRCEPLRSRKLVFFASRHHPLARKSKVTLAEISAAPLIIRSTPGTPANNVERILRGLKARGVELNVGMRCEEPYAIVAAVRKSLGVVEGHGLKLEGSLFIIYPKARELSPVAQELLQMLRGMRSKRFRSSASATLTQAVSATRA